MFNWQIDKKKIARDRRSKILSAYIDGTLSLSEKSRLEIELEQDKALRRELEQLDRTVRLLRTTPTLSVPRSFTLDPAIYGKEKPRRIHFYPILSAATVVATMLLIVFSVGNLFLAGGRMASELPADTLAMQKEAYHAEIPEMEKTITQAPSMQKAPLGESMNVEEPAAEEMADVAAVEMEEALPFETDVQAEIVPEEAQVMREAEAPASVWATQPPQPTPSAAFGSAPKVIETVQTEAEPATLPDGGEGVRALQTGTIEELAAPTIQAGDDDTNALQAGTSEEQALPLTQPIPPTPIPTLAIPSPIPRTNIYPTGEIPTPKIDNTVQPVPTVPEEQPFDWFPVVQSGLVILAIGFLVGAYLARRFGW
ncbi:MAG: hypothetical protein JXA42_12005 [Anaerolineales bacterium]|nr:hypothetical protein [Anaerolineales bacterium]